MKNALINLNANSLNVLENALNVYHDHLGKSSNQFCYMFNTQPKATADILLKSAEYQDHLNEVGQVNLLKKQIDYQKRKLK